MTQVRQVTLTPPRQELSPHQRAPAPAKKVGPAKPKPPERWPGLGRGAAVRHAQVGEGSWRPPGGEAGGGHGRCGQRPPGRSSALMHMGGRGPGMQRRLRRRRAASWDGVRAVTAPHGAARPRATSGVCSVQATEPLASCAVHTEVS